MNDDSFIFHDPSKETSFRWQREKETQGGSVHQGPPPWNEGDRLNDFVLERLLGSGSSGFVFRALDIKTNRRCALKLLTDAAPDDLLRNKLGFRRMMSIEHPNLLRVDRIYQLGSSIALSMDEIDGVTLKQALRGFKSLNPDEAYQRLLGLLRDYASGLAAMHAAGYIHRDIKPDNLMVDRQGRGRVIDYGLVDAYELDQVAIGARGFLLGTPHYFAPEVIWSQRYLPAGDIFSLGIVMLDALGAIQSFAKGKRQTELERSNRNQRDDRERIDEAIEGLSESVPATILEACREMLDRQPSDRPTAMELARLGVSRPSSLVWPHEEPLIGRDAERREIVSWVEEIFCGNVGRLHLTGPSGIGKSRLIEQIVKHIESKHWGQVFCARCRVREDQPLQAFDQICDAITNRYMQGDRERLELDPVSVGMLQEIFPVLKNVFTSSMQSPLCGGHVEPVDALDAAVRMSEQLRLVGPLFLIVDDTQWADRDSLNVLDRLQTAVGREGLGIITISRETQDPQRLPANKNVHLGPLSLTDSVTILARAADRWNVEVAPGMLEKLAEATGGSPFRLRELADEFRPGGVLAELSEDPDGSASFSWLGRIDELWRRRAQRLSDDAMEVLTYVVASGGRVSTQQLGELTGLGDAVDAAVSELSRQRLITDEATGGECISIFHDHVADELFKTLPSDALVRASLAWALLLSRYDHPETLAARIAGHFIAAGEPGRAVHHAILAAEDAERRAAISEAARWYARVVDHLEGAEKIKALRNAARCYHKADFPLAAADCYRQLGQLVDQDERVECQLMAISLLIRSGRFESARHELSTFAASLGLPRAQSPWKSKLSLLAGEAFAIIRGRHARLTSLMESIPAQCSETTQGHETEPTEIAEESREDSAAGDTTALVDVDANPSLRVWRRLRAIRFCSLLVRPLALYDNLYAADLCLKASRLAARSGSCSQKIDFAISESVFACYDQGIRRIEGEANLLALKPHVEALRCDFMTGEFWSGIAYSHALACRWDQVAQPVEFSLQHYQAAGNSHGFELAFTQWIDLWAKWNLGRWSQMSNIAEHMLDDGRRRDNLLQQRLASSGFSASAFLASDREDRLHSLLARQADASGTKESRQILDVFDWIASLQLLIYQGQFQEAWYRFETFDSQLNRFPYSKMQVIRVSRAMLGSLIAIHNLTREFSDMWRLRAQVRIDQLRKENLGYATMLANFYEGLLQSCVARQERSEPALTLARARLIKAREQALAAHLRPFQLAAEDVLCRIETGRSSERLNTRMQRQRIACPVSFQRLYTIALEESGTSFTG